MNSPTSQIANPMPARSLFHASLGALLLPVCILTAGCPNEPEFEQVNVEDDCLLVVVSPDTDGDDADFDPWLVKTPQLEEGLSDIDLTSRPGVFSEDIIGSAAITPDAGPAGTRFFLAVELNDTGESQGNPTAVVDRVTVKVDNGSLSLHEFDLDPSPADESNWTITLAAGGDPDTSSRNDSLCVALYASVE